jgi:hypothetical protein
MPDQPLQEENQARFDVQADVRRDMERSAEQEHSLEFNARVEELKSHWKKAQVAANTIGYVKPEGMSWDEAATHIVYAELQQGRRPVQAQTDLVAAQSDRLIQPSLQVTGVHTDFSATPEDAKPKYSTAYFEANGIPFCEACGDQLTSNDLGEPNCPENRSDCPQKK